MWLDCDTLVTNNSIKVEQFIESLFHSIYKESNLKNISNEENAILFNNNNNNNNNNNINMNNISVIFSRDPMKGFPINTGVMFLRRTLWLEELFTEALSKHAPLNYSQGNWEQDYLSLILLERKEIINNNNWK